MARKNKKNNKLKKSVLLVMGLFLCGGVLATLNNYEKNNPVISNPAEDVKVVNQGIKIRMLSTSTNDNGEEDKVFTYSISPENATNQSVTLTLSYIDGSDCSSVMEASLNEDDKEITLSCKGAFSKQIKLVITSKDNSSATATITMDYVKKLKAITPISGGPLYIGIWNSGSPAYGGITSLAPSSFVNAGYSVYTKDKTYTFKATVNSIDLTAKVVSSEISSVADSVGTALKTKIKEKIEAGSSYLSASELWNLSDSNSYHSYLATIGSMSLSEYQRSSSGYFTFKVIMKYTCPEDYTKSYQFSDLTLHASLYGDYSANTVSVDSLSSEVSSLEF